MTTTTALGRPLVEGLVADAVRAPSLHNSQPWRFRAHGDVVDVYADQTRAVPVVDPSGRALVLSVGAAVLNLRLSVMVRLEREPLTRLLPDAGDPTHLARVQVSGRHQPTAMECRLHAALPRRRTSREPFEERRVGPELMERLRTAAHVEGAELVPLDADMVDWVLELTGEAERTWAGDPRYVAEVQRWTTIDPQRDDGVPAQAFGPRDHAARLHPRDFGVGRPERARATVAFEAHPQLAVLTTTRDRVVDQLRAGQALQRVLLTATDAGLGVGLLHQPVELADLRRLLRHPASGPSSAQIVLRLGWPTAERPATVPRRPVAEVLDVDEPAGGPTPTQAGP